MITCSPALRRQLGLSVYPSHYHCASYLGSLKLFAELPDRRMLPAHGHLADATRSRADELLAHHEDRLRLIGDLVSAGATTAYAGAAQMRWTRHDKPLSALDTIHRMTAILEVQAHLDLLAFQGRLAADESGDESTFTAR